MLTDYYKNLNVANDICSKIISLASFIEIGKLFIWHISSLNIIGHCSSVMLNSLN